MRWMQLGMKYGFNMLFRYHIILHAIGDCAVESKSKWIYHETALASELGLLQNASSYYGRDLPSSHSCHHCIRQRWA